MKTFEGQVISGKMPRTATVLVERHFRHPVYGKILRRSSKIHAANHIGAVVGERVIVEETRPVAKTVSFKIKEIIKPIKPKVPKKTLKRKKSKKDSSKDK